MKIKLYFENEKAISKSGIGRALKHQQVALDLNHIEYTTLHQDNDYDILHINTVWLASYLQVKKAKRMHKKIVFHAHSTMEDFKNSFMFSNQLAPIYKKWLVHMYNYGDVIVTPTPYSKSVLQGYGIQKPIYAVSNGIDVSQFAYNEEYVKEFRSFFHLDDKQIVIISVGWLFERKGFDTFCNIARKFPEYTFIWFGDKNLSAPTKKIRKILSDLPKNVILPGYISGNIIKGAYCGANLFFFPSREETEGIVVLEALASNIPVLVRDIPVYHGWLEDQKNCYMGENYQDFVNLIPQILSQDNTNIIKNGYDLARSKSLGNIGMELKKVYRTLFERS